MKNTFGNSVSITVFGESHGEGVGAVLDGIAPGIPVNQDFIRTRLDMRKSVGEISTPRRESDNFIIESGVYNGYTTGSPICIYIPNENTNSNDYMENRSKARPGHADYTSFCKYHGYEDFRGGGHFSGRVTAAVVAVGAIAVYALEKKKIYIGTHIKRCGGVSDCEFNNLSKDINLLNNRNFAVLDNSAELKMKQAILDAKNNGDSVGGILETAVIGLPAGIGEPWFDSIESLLSHALFSVPAVKGIEFGDGFIMADMMGSKANDEFEIKDGKILTETNSNGGINGGITNGMPVIFRCVVKPTPTISKVQKTVDFMNNIDTDIISKGRHDPCIVHRARAVVDSVTALTLCDILCSRYGTDWLVK